MGMHASLTQQPQPAAPADRLCRQRPPPRHHRQIRRQIHRAQQPQVLWQSQRHAAASRRVSALAVADRDAAAAPASAADSDFAQADAAADSAADSAKGKPLELGAVADVEELRGVRVNVDDVGQPLVEYLVHWKVR